MTPLDERLRALGDRLDLEAADLVDQVLARVDEPAQADSSRRQVTRGTRWLRVAAAVVLVVVAVVTIVPSSRRTVAGWLGFDGATIERDPRIEVPERPDPLDDRGVGTTAEVDGRTILFAEFEGTLANPGLAKTLGDESTVTEVSVGGAFGLWIDGEPHEVSFLDQDGTIVFEGFAGNTLVWQDGATVRRLEGFETSTAAVAYAESLRDGP